MFLNCFIRREFLVPWSLLMLSLSLVPLFGQSGTSTTPSATITLSPTTSPTAAQPGVTVVNATGSNFPGGTILPGDVTITLAPATPGAGPTLYATATTVTTIVGSTRRVTFQVPASRSLVPNLAAAATTLTVQINLPAGNAFSGAPTASFGTGVSVGAGPSGGPGPLTILNSTTATAQLAIEAGAPAGARAVTLQLSSQTITLPDSFVVTNNDSTIPTAAPGISVAAPIPYLVSVSGTDSNGAAFSSGNTAKITLNPGASIASVTPAQAAPGQSVSVTLTGQYTNFVQGSTKASFGPGISVGGAAEGTSGPVTVTSLTSATARLVIDPAAASGPRSVAVATGVQQASAINGFLVTIQPPQPSITMSPNSAPQTGLSVPVSILGQNTHFVQATTQVSLGSDITVTSVTVANATSLTVTIVMSPTVNLGAHTVTVTTGNEVVHGIFAVTPGTPAILSVSPNTSQQGQQSLSATITSQLTNFVQGTTVASFGAGITVVSLTVNSSTSATAVLNIDGTAAVGSRTVALTTGTESATLTGGFTVSAGSCSPIPAGLVGWWPGNGDANDQSGNHLDGTVQGGVTFVPSVVGQAFNFDGATGIVSVPASAPLDIRSAVTIVAWINPSKFRSPTPGTCAGFTAGCVLIAGRPEGYQFGIVPDGHLRFAFPNAGTGQVKNFFDSIGTVPLGVFTFVSATYDSATGTIAIYINGVLDSTAPASGLIDEESKPFQIGAFSEPTLAPGYGSYTGVIDEVQLFSRALSAAEVQTIFNAGSFGVCAIPIINSVSPSTGHPGQQNLSVVITGQNTHFSPGTTQVGFGLDITVNSVTVTDVTSLTAIITIPPTAILGAHSVTVISGSEVATLANGFTVNAVVVNQPPIVNAGPNQTVTLPNNAQLNGAISDDGLPIGATLTANWSVVNAPLSTGSQMWLKLAPSGTLPSARNEDSVVFDPATDRMIMFGGLSGGPPLQATNDVWILADANGLNASPSWTQSQPSGNAPCPRYGHAAFYDPASNRMVIFGGVNSTCCNFLNDVWVLTNANGIGGTPTWIQLFPTGVAPSPRTYAGIAFDATTNRMMIFGGLTSATSATNDSWVLTNATGTETGGSAWIQLTPGGNLPQSRQNPFVAFDPGSDRLILFGGQFGQNDNVLESFNDTWILTNANGLGGSAAWTQLTPDRAATSPTRRAEGQIAYNPKNNILTISGGIGNCVGVSQCTAFTDLWTLSNANGLGGASTWMPRSPTGGPPAPLGFATYDAANDRLISFGGGGGYQVPVIFYNDTWVLTNATLSDLGGVPGTVNFSNPTFSTPDLAGQSFPVTTAAAFSIPGSYVLRLTGSDSNLSSTSDVTVTVLSPRGTPVLTAAVPNVGQQGQTNVAVTLTGQNTHFVQGITQISFGSDITVNSVAVTTVTSLTANTTIPATATLGAHTVTATTGSEVATLASGFTITSGTVNQPPTIISQPPQARTWVKQSPAGTPPQGRDFRDSFDVYDPVNDRLMMFSGEVKSDGQPCGWEAPPDVWVLTNASGSAGTPAWIQLNPPPGPQGRFENIVAYSQTSNRLIIQGGGKRGLCALAFADTWVLTNANGLGGTPNWIRLPDFPSLIAEHSAVFDDSNNRLMIFGGVTSASGSATNDVWVLTDANGVGSPTWVHLSPTGTPPPRQTAAPMAYDAVTNRLIVFDRTASGVFVLTNANGIGGTPQWTQLNPTGPTPAPRFGYLRYDPTANQAFLRGNVSSGTGNTITFAPDDGLWILSNANGLGGTPVWSQTLPQGEPPELRVLFAAAYQKASDRMIIAMGQPGAWVFSNDVWVLTPPISRVVAGQTFSYQVAATDPNGSVLTFSLDSAPAGMTIDPASGLIVWTPVVSQVGTYTITARVGNTSNLSNAQTFDLTVLPNNDPPIVAAFAVDPITLPSTASLVGRVFDDGNPAGNTLSFTWSEVSGPGSVTFSDPAGPIANGDPNGFTTTTASFSNPGTYVLRISVNDGQLTGSDDTTVVVNSPSGVPAIFSISPNTGQQGQQNISVAITGQNTNFVQGTSQVSFGTGITVNSVTVTDATDLTASISITPAAAVGSYTVTVTTGSEVDSLANGFTVTSPTTTLPVIMTISPSSGQQGQGGPIGIDGANTHFVQGVTQVDIGPGITVSGINVSCPTCLTAQASIASDAPTGPRNVTVTTGTEVATLANGFTVTAGTPMIVALNHASILQGQSELLAITGRFTHFAQGTTQVDLGSGITVGAVSVSSPTSVTVPIIADVAASVGARTLTVTTGSEVVTLTGVFSVAPGTPIVTTLNPGSGQQGQQNLAVAITGAFTHFVQGTTQASFGVGITVSSLAIAGSTSATAVLNIDPTAVVGPRTVTLTTGTETASFVNGFTVSPPTPIVQSLNPGGTSQGVQNFSVAITGFDTHWVQGTTTASFGAGISVVSLTVASATSATAVINVDPTAATGPRTVALTTGSEVASFGNGFNIVPGVAGITEINPGSGPQGAQNLSVAVTAQFTHWVQGTTVANFGAEVTIVSLTIASPTTATVVVNIDPGAATGARDVTFTTGTEVEKVPGGFTITPSAPTLTQVSPSSGQQGQQRLSVTITGQNTHFQQGTTAANFGPGITVGSLTVASSTGATAVVNIDPSASTGTRTVVVTTASEAASLANAFTVTPGTPVLTQVSPNTGQEGQQNLSITITGQFTNFAQGTSQVSFGAGITVSTVSVSSPTSLIADVSISANAAQGPQNVTVTTGTEVDAFPGGFTVQGPTGPVSVSPGSGIQGQSLPVTITAQGAAFVQGTTQARFGPGVIVGSGVAGGFGPVTVTSPTTATAQLTILTSALPAFRNVTVQTGTAQLTGLNAFIVVGLPILSAVSPNSAKQGQTGTVSIGGTFTNFAQGTTQVSFGAGISVGGGQVGGFGPVMVNSPISATAQITIDPAATLGLRTVVAQTGAEQASGTNSFSVLGPVTGPPPVVSITSPTEASELTAPTSVTGTVTSSNLDYWTLEYEAPTATSFTQFATGTTSAVTGAFDPTLLLNGNAVIRLTGIDTSGQTTSTTVTVVITRNLKIGNFTVSFNDLTIPVAGLPIQVVRTYDSRFKGRGDFGIGGRLDLSAAQVSENITLGDQWNETTTGGNFPTYCVVPTATHLITVSLSDGTTYEFQPRLTPNCQSLVPIQDSQVTVTFTPTGITPPDAALAIAGNSQPFVEGAVPGPVSLTDLDNVTIFDPDQYILTLPDGRALQISSTLGLQSITDLNGNKLTVTPTGITSSTGKSVTFARDSQNRIQTITDPNGNQINYAYNSSGDLTSFTDQANNTSTYTYDTNHDLLTILDPRGVQPIRNDYDANGRLVSHTDVFGNVINYDHDIGASQEIVTDRLGNVTVNAYDSAGNIIQVTDPLGGITKRTYDAHGNVLTETNALGKTRTYTYDPNNNRLTETDPLGNTTTYTYNSRNQVLTITDALNRVTTNTYDSSGNLLSTKDAAGNTTSYTYNASGLRTSTTDALGNVTTYQYDSSDNLTQQTDALGNATTYTYDSNGNKLTETRTRTTNSGPETLVTSYHYDGLNRLTQTTYPDGSTTQIQYNSIGKQGATIDQLGRQTSYQYDLMGRLTQTTYPDATTESSTYDAEGDRVNSTDRGGRTTSYTYDSLKRLTQTTYADKTSTSTGYDPIGEVTSVKDANGNLTQYAYDDAGRRTQVTDAFGHVTTFAYDKVGNQASMTDANGNTTQYQYDALNRRTAVVYPDTTTDATAYDALGRTTIKTDQAGKTTQFAYDKVGRLIQVTDALNQLTKYTYDEVGNRIIQTDANNHTTRFAYDQMGRRRQRTLPLGQSETYMYDAAGNLKTKTDFNGKTTTYTYDLSNRLASKIPDASFAAPTVSFAYTATGQRLSMTDASGTTNYAYDLRDHLTQKLTAAGTLTYSYDSAGNLTSMQSSNVGGTSMTYAFDALNRLSTAKDNRLAAGTTTYNYDNAGNLQGYAYPNGAQTAYTYNTLNRLTNVGVANGSGTITSYAYTLGPAGNRTAVAEFAGRQVNYIYDALYRLIGETISGSADASNNGTVGYTYDPVGNRLQRASTLTPVPDASYTYDANDRLSTDTYDLNGNTTASVGSTYGYDFENHLLTQNGGAVTMVYDGDGNRVAKSAGSITTQYLIDDRNLTGYVQVLEEVVGGAVHRVYTYGLNRISQSQASGTSFYGYDGHGSVRLLTDTTGAVTDRYDYDAFGNVISQTGTTPNVYLFSSEQWDSNLRSIYLRARYYAPTIGRFLSADSRIGYPFDPMSLHRYTYVYNDPLMAVDPSGNETLLELQFSLTVRSILISVNSQIATTIYKEVLDKFAPSPGQVLKDTAIAATIGTFSGIAGFYVGELAEGLSISGYIAGSASAAVGRVLQEFADWSTHKQQITLVDAAKRVAVVTFVGFITGGFFAHVEEVNSISVPNAFFVQRLAPFPVLVPIGYEQVIAGTVGRVTALGLGEILGDAYTNAAAEELIP